MTGVPKTDGATCKENRHVDVLHMPRPQSLGMKQLLLGNIRTLGPRSIRCTSFGSLACSLFLDSLTTQVRAPGYRLAAAVRQALRSVFSAHACRFHTLPESGPQNRQSRKLKFSRPEGKFSRQRCRRLVVWGLLRFRLRGGLHHVGFSLSF